MSMINNSTSTIWPYTNARKSTVVAHALIIYTVFSVISVIVLFSNAIIKTKIRNPKCKRMRIHNVNVYGKGSPRSKITLHENLKFE